MNRSRYEDLIAENAWLRRRVEELEERGINENWEQSLRDFMRFCKQSLRCVRSGRGGYQIYRPHRDDSHLIQMDTLKKYIGSYQGKRILDAGCGSGLNVICMAEEGAHCMGVDKSQQALDFLKYLAERSGLDNIEAVKADFTALRFEDSAFDVVFNDGVFEEIDDDVRKELIKEMARVSREFVIAIIPNQTPLGCVYDKLYKKGRYPAEVQECFTLDNLIDLFRGAGLEIVDSGNFDLVIERRNLEMIDQEHREFYTKHRPSKGLDCKVEGWEKDLINAKKSGDTLPEPTDDIIESVTKWAEDWRCIERSLSKDQLDRYGHKFFVIGKVKFL